MSCSCPIIRAAAETENASHLLAHETGAQHAGQRCNQIRACRRMRRTAYAHCNGSVMRTACMILFKLMPTSYFFEKTACTAVHNHQDTAANCACRERQLNRRAGVNGSLPARGDGVDGTAGAAPAAGGSSALAASSTPRPSEKLTASSTVCLPEPSSFALDAASCGSSSSLVDTTAPSTLRMRAPCSVRRRHNALNCSVCHMLSNTT